MGGAWTRYHFRPGIGKPQRNDTGPMRTRAYDHVDQGPVTAASAFLLEGTQVPGLVQKV